MSENTNANKNIEKNQNQLQKVVKQDVKEYTRLRPPNIIIENSRWNMGPTQRQTPLPKPVLNRSEQPVISNVCYVDSDIESEL
jgi:hypothetical protein